MQVANAIQRALALAAARREGRSPIEEDASPLGQPHGAPGAARATRLPSMCASLAGRLLLCMDRLSRSLLCSVCPAWAVHVVARLLG